MATHCSILVLRTPWAEECGVTKSQIQMSYLACTHTHTHTHTHTQICTHIYIHTHSENET